MGHDSHTGFVTDGTRAGVPVLRIADWDGRVFVEVPGSALYAYRPLPTPLRRPDAPQPRALTAGSSDPWGRDDDYDDEEDVF
jgi:hypothetical protein